jgi:predicted RNase H-like HicB family nuclease
MRREFNVIIEKDSDGFFVGHVPQLKGCHSQAKSIDELMKRMTEAIELCLEAEENDPFVSEFVGVQRVVINA